jgi:hypothetical protein
MLLGNESRKTNDLPGSLAAACAASFFIYQLRINAGKELASSEYCS